MPESLGVTVKETSRLLKYAEGKVPGVDEPDEVLEQSRTLSQGEVQDLKNQGALRVTEDGKVEWNPEYVKELKNASH